MAEPHSDQITPGRTNSNVVAPVHHASPQGDADRLEPPAQDETAEARAHADEHPPHGAEQEPAAEVAEPTVGDNGARESPKTNLGSGRPTKMGWGDNTERSPEDLKKQNDFLENKNAVELLMTYKVIQRLQVQQAFGWNLAQMFIYIVFLILFSVNNYYNPYVMNSYSIKSMVATSFQNGQVPLADVTSIDKIYEYLEQTVIPAVSAQNVTKLDHRCTADGRHKAPECLENPFANEALCCFTKQPNKGIFTPGRRSKNMLMAAVTVRQQRVQLKAAASPLGYQILRWPVLTGEVEETRDGGGTILDHDPDGMLLDWPSDAVWYKYNLCSGSYCVPDERLTFEFRTKPAPQYSMSGYTAILNGTSDEMSAELNRLKKYEFLGGSTRAVFVDLTALFPGEMLFAQVSILFEITSTDVLVSPRISVRVTNLRRGAEWIILDYCVFGYVGLLALFEIYKMASGLKQYWAEEAPWAVITWINYGMFSWCFYELFQLDLDTATIDGLVPLSEEAQKYPWIDRVTRMDEYYSLTSYNCFLSWLRMIRYLEEMSPSNKQLVLTITEAFQDICVLFVMLGIVMMGFMQAYNLQFGSQMADFADWQSAFMALFRMLFGEFDFAGLVQTAGFVRAGTWFIGFIILFVLLIVNMFLAIVMKTYDSVAAGLALKARTEVTGFGMLKQYLKGVVRLMGARNLDDLKTVSPDSNLDGTQI